MPAEVSRRLAALLLALALGACSRHVVLRETPGMSASLTDGRFRIEWGRAQNRQGQPLIDGYVTNTGGSGVTNLRMQVQTLDAQGKVTDSTTALAPGYVGGFGRTYFEVPLEKTGTGYRVNVLSWDSAGNGQ